MFRKKMFVVLFIFVIFLPLIQMNLNIVEKEKLSGAEVKNERPDFHFEKYMKKNYQKLFEHGLNKILALEVM